MCNVALRFFSEGRECMAYDALGKKGGNTQNKLNYVSVWELSGTLVLISVYNILSCSLIC